MAAEPEPRQEPPEPGATTDEIMAYFRSLHRRLSIDWQAGVFDYVLPVARLFPVIRKRKVKEIKEAEGSRTGASFRKAHHRMKPFDYACDANNIGTALKPRCDGSTIPTVLNFLAGGRRVITRHASSPKCARNS